jgi:hypothetical protein
MSHGGFNVGFPEYAPSILNPRASSSAASSSQSRVGLICAFFHRTLLGSIRGASWPRKCVIKMAMIDVITLRNPGRTFAYQTQARSTILPILKCDVALSPIQFFVNNLV